MTPDEFIRKWSPSELTERQGSQSHFNDLCDLLNHPKPADIDHTGESFTFDKGVEKHGGGEGFADVWKKDYFGWEYKGKHKGLDAAYEQLIQYKDDLGNPPLLVVCDFERIIIHTNFTGTKPDTHIITLADLDQPDKREILHNVFFATEKLKPGSVEQLVTEKTAAHIAQIAESVRSRGVPPTHVAHFLDRIVFCLFAQNVRLLPEQLFTTIVGNSSNDPKRFAKLIGELFIQMANGGDFGAETIRHFNGNLFDTSPVLELTLDEIKAIEFAATFDWRKVDPTIFGTLFERGLDPAKRAQIGAHYTSRADIETIVEPVGMQPLRCEWAAVREQADKLLADDAKKSRPKAEQKILGFLERLRTVRVLDPAGGSGNFLYVTLQKLLDLEKEVNDHLAKSGYTPQFPHVSPVQLYCIEINSYAHDLAQMTVLIGYIQWLNAHGYGFPAEPILQRLDKNFFCKDSILDLSDREHPKEADWPDVDFIVSNPPFLGGKKLRNGDSKSPGSGLGDEYVDDLFSVWNERVPREADLCCYWLEKARQQIAAGKCYRAGLLATQRIRTGANRKVIQHIKASGGIFFAESDRDWILDGASVHVSMIGFDNGEDRARVLDGKPVSAINANLTAAAADLTEARKIAENCGIAFMGDTKVGPFEIPETLAREWMPLRNPNGKPNSDVVQPWANGLEVTRQPQHLWIVDFPPGMSEAEAAQYESPFEYIREHVKPKRLTNKRAVYAKRWWIHGEARPEMRAKIAKLKRYIATPCVSKHRIFVWLDAGILPDHQLIVFARDDDFFFGVLHSRPHEVWALATCGRLETRPQYTPTTSFETYPLPEPTTEQVVAIAVAAKEMNDKRNNILNDPNGDAKSLTALYNKLEEGEATWLANAHEKLDAAVFAAYGWPAGLADEQILERLLALNQERSETGAQPVHGGGKLSELGDFDPNKIGERVPIQDVTDQLNGSAVQIVGLKAPEPQRKRSRP
jgi:type II restriction/modification system DNA methylase subunit YeeA